MLARVFTRVLGRVMLAGFLGVMRGVKGVAVGDMGVMRSLDVILVVVMLGRTPMMLSRLFVVIRRLPVMLCALVLRHGCLWRDARLPRVCNDDSLFVFVGALTFEADEDVRQTQFRHEAAVVV